MITKIKKISYIIIFILTILAFNQLFILPAYIFGKENEVAEIVKEVLHPLMGYVYEYGLDSPIYYSGEYNRTNKVDIIIGNHNQTFDFVNILTLIRNFDDKNFSYIYYKNTTVYIPGMGFVLVSGNDISIDRNFDSDENTIFNSIKNMKSGNIIIMPEGTRITKEKQIKAINYAKKHNLPIFKNLLYPKMKGLWLIINILKKNNALGNIIDISTFIENLSNDNITTDKLFNENMGKTYSLIRTYKIPNTNLLDYDIFKEWFLEIWEKKDKEFDSILNNNFKKNKLELDIKNILIYVIVLILFLYLNYQTNFIFLILSVIISYLIIYMKT